MRGGKVLAPMVCEPTCVYALWAHIVQIVFRALCHEINEDESVEVTLYEEFVSEN